MTSIRTRSAFLAAMLITAAVGCRSATPPPGEPPAPTPRPSLSAEACATEGGTVVGDIGDGAIHRPDYRCPSGSPPLGTIVSPAGEPIAIEGAVCCPT